MKKAQEIAQRIIALFLSSALAIVGGSAIIAPELDLWKSAALSGLAATFQVIQKLATSAIDGQLTKTEIDAAFGVKPKSSDNE